MKTLSILLLVLLVAAQQTHAWKRSKYVNPYRPRRSEAAGAEFYQDYVDFLTAKRAGDNLVDGCEDALNTTKEEEEGKEEEEEDAGETSNIIRAITMTLIFILSMIFGLLPLKTLSLKYRSRIASIANCFGGGVFFGTCFMHLIPEVKMQINAYVEYLEEGIMEGLGPCQKPPGYLEFLEKLPIPEFLECSGFLLILSIEKIAESAKKIRPLTQRFSVFISTKKLKTARNIVQKQSDLEAIPDGCEDDHSQGTSCDDCKSEPDNESVKEDRDRKKSAASVSSITSTGSKTRGVPKAFLSAMKGNLYNKIQNMGPKDEEDPCVPGEQPSHKKSAAMLIMALSIHSFFEGLAIGVESTEAVFIQLAAAITVHKCVIAFAVGSRLIHSGKTVWGMTMCLGCMSIMTPVGVSLAMIIVGALDSNTILIVSGTIQGISTGFFLYITFAEMLFQEMKSKQDSFLKVSFMTFGVMLVTASTIWHNWNGAHAHE